MPQTVLLVDDDTNLLDSLLRTLRREPYQVRTASSGEQALEMLGAGDIDVVVSDDQMPGMTGLELLTTVRQRHPRIISLMLSGQASIGTVVRALNHGQIFRFLIKPCSAEELCASIRQALAHKHLLDQCRMMLPLFRRQVGVLVAIERAQPGLIRSVGNQMSSPDVRDGLETIDDLNECMDVEIRRAGTGVVVGETG
jgi:DNA-binding NtrC family response regulator